MDPVIIGIAVINGIMLGGLYGAVALGLSLIFGVMRVINFAHGSFLMTGMFIPYWLWALLGINPYVSVLVTAPALFALGYLVQSTIILPLFKRERAMVLEPLSVLLLTAGLFIIMDNTALLLFGPDYRAVRMDFSMKAVRFGLLTINYSRFLAFLVSIGITVALSYFLARSDLGRSIRATALNRDAAALCGINVPRVYNITFGIGCSVLGIIGCFMVPFYYVSPSVGVAFGIRSFIIVVLGGIGSIPGSILGGLILGVVESVGGQFVTATSASIFSFVIFILVLFFKPTGLMGQRV
ncbi:MAG: branched-chain amino acid ABC transporter permease [Deltaproteobacteria bacterium]|nr:branched-chain amino acid ABC transporter permease [Deltaproteobacteria bacterium]